MGKENIIVGLEIGTSKICVVVGEAKTDGNIRILGVGHAPSRGVRKGEIVDFDTAQKCVREALVDAEEKSDVMIEGVYVGVTGAHVFSFNNRGVVMIPEDQDEIYDCDCDSVRGNAREVSLPSQNVFIHSILQHYYIDGQDGVLNPVGMMGRKLEADFHIIHGVGTRIKNAIRCVREIGLEVEDVVFNPFAASQVVLDQNEKNLGALVIDIGGGTTDYIVYIDGAVKQSGVLAIGGDHISNDISMGLRIPIARAEKLKVEEGSTTLGNSLPGEMIFLKDDHGFAGKEIEREMLNKIIHWRMRETFELLKSTLEPDGYLDLIGAGIFITGGTSQLKGIDHLAQDIFEMPVHLTHAQTVAGVTAAFENPKFSTAIGLIKYAQAIQFDRPSGWFGRFKKKLPTFFGGSR